MKQNYYSAPSVPSASIAVNKSRLKLYTNAGDMPVYYLQKGTEFQIELFNPTSDVLLAKIELNGKPISQGGLVINPGERVFLDRYLDIAKKFMFDTYSVSNTEEVKAAIKANGDIKVQFFKEKKPFTPAFIQTDYWKSYFTSPAIPYSGTDPNFLRSGSTNVDPNNGILRSANEYNYNDNSMGQCSLYSSKIDLGSNLNTSLCITSSSFCDPNMSTLTTASNTKTINTVTTDSLSDDYYGVQANSTKRSIRSRGFAKETNSKSIETGRVEAGSDSNQKFKYVSKEFEYFAFHTIEYKMLPISQKINTSEDLNVKVYCTNCGAKLGKTDRFCASCGKKA